MPFTVVPQNAEKAQTVRELTCAPRHSELSKFDTDTALVERARLMEEIDKDVSSERAALRKFKNNETNKRKYAGKVGREFSPQVSEKPTDVVKDEKTEAASIRGIAKATGLSKDKIEHAFARAKVRERVLTLELPG